MGDPVSHAAGLRRPLAPHRPGGRARAAGAARGPADRAAPGVAQAPVEALLVSTCNRVELYVVGPGDDRQERTRDVAGRGRPETTWSLPLRAPRRGRGAPPVPGGREPRLHGPRRAADPRPGEGRLRAGAAPGRRARRAGSHLRGRLRERQAGPHRDGARPRRHVDGFRRGGAGPASLRRARRTRRCSSSERGRDGRAGRQAPPARPARPGSWWPTAPSSGREALAASLGGQAVPFDRMEESLVLADVVVCTTASPAPVITREKVAAVLQAPEAPPAVPGGPRGAAGHRPRTCTRWTASTPTTWTTSRGSSTENQASRAAEAARAEVVVAEEVARYLRQRAVREQVPVLAQLRAAGRADRPRRGGAGAGQPLGPRSRRAAGEDHRGDDLGHREQAAPPAHGEAARRVRTADSELADAAAELFGLDGTPRKAGEG